MADRLTPRQIARAAGLCFVAGFVDAVGYTELGNVFAANMTGNTVLCAVALVRGEMERAGSYATTLGSFLVGAVVAAVLRRLSGRPAEGLLAAVALLSIAAAAPMDHTTRLALLAAAMGLQGGSLSRFGPASLQTVVVTGTLVRLTDMVVDHFMPTSAQRGGTTRLDFGAWVSYGIGAAAAIGVARVSAHPLLLAAMVLLLIAAEVTAEGGLRA